MSDGFDEFVHLYVMNFPNYENLPVHFIGSIAFHYSDILADVAKANKINLGKILQKPIDGLLNYHRER